MRQTWCAFDVYNPVSLRVLVPRPQPAMIALFDFLKKTIFQRQLLSYGLIHVPATSVPYVVRVAKPRFVCWFSTFFVLADLAHIWISISSSWSMYSMSGRFAVPCS